MGNALLPIIILLALSGFWAMHVVFSKLVNAQDIQEILAVLLLYLCGTSLLIWTVLLFNQRSLPKLRSTGTFFFITAAGGHLLPVIVELGVMPKIPIAVFLFIGTLVPVVTLTVSWVFRLRTVRIGHLVGVVLGLCAVLLLLGNPFSAEGGWNVWYFVALLAPIGYGIVDCYIEHCWPSKLSLLEVAAGDSLLALGYTLIAAVLFGVSAEDLVDAVDDKAALIGVLVFSGLMSALLFFYLVRCAGAVYVSFGAFVALLVGMAIDGLFFNETLPEYFAYALVLLIASLLVLRYSSRSRAGREVVH